MAMFRPGQRVLESLQAAFLEHPAKLRHFSALVPSFGADIVQSYVV
jgi:hypothetical protein